MPSARARPERNVIEEMCAVLPAEDAEFVLHAEHVGIGEIDKIGGASAGFQ